VVLYMLVLAHHDGNTVVLWRYMISGLPVKLEMERTRWEKSAKSIKCWWGLESHTEEQGDLMQFWHCGLLMTLLIKPHYLFKVKHLPPNPHPPQLPPCGALNSAKWLWEKLYKWYCKGRSGSWPPEEPKHT